jgi:hypothetical protein
VWEGFKEFVKVIWDWTRDTIQEIWDKYWEWVWWIGEWFWDTFQDFLDWSIGIPYDIFVWLLGKFPTINLPGGWENGMTVFIRFGRLLDQIFPVSELFVLVSLYVTILLFLTVGKYLWRFIIAIIP